MISSFAVFQLMRNRKSAGKSLDTIKVHTKKGIVILEPFWRKGGHFDMGDTGHRFKNLITNGNYENPKVAFYVRIREFTIGGYKILHDSSVDALLDGKFVFTKCTDIERKCRYKRKDILSQYILKGCSQMI